MGDGETQRTYPDATAMTCLANDDPGLRPPAAGTAPRPADVLWVQLEEVKAEWCRRHPKRLPDDGDRSG